MRWVSMKAHPEGDVLKMEGDGFLAPSYASVALLPDVEIEDDDWLQVELDSDEYPVTVDHEGARIWPYPQ
jgi:hypothetical protein